MLFVVGSKEFCKENGFILPDYDNVVESIYAGIIDYIEVDKVGLVNNYLEPFNEPHSLLVLKRIYELDEDEEGMPVFVDKNIDCKDIDEYIRSKIDEYPPIVGEIDVEKTLQMMKGEAEKRIKRVENLRKDDDVFNHMGKLALMSIDELFLPDIFFADERSFHALPVFANMLKRHKDGSYIVYAVGEYDIFY